MKGDFTRFSHNPRKHYSRVLEQQGRVELDADQRESQDIHIDATRIRTIDVVGKTGAPLHDPGYGVEWDNTQFVLTAGRMYVDGILARLDADRNGTPLERGDTTPYTQQPDLPPPIAPIPRGTHALVYLDVWERHITHLEDPELLDSALDGVDTTTRTRTIAQVRWHPLPDEESDCYDDAIWNQVTAPPDSQASMWTVAIPPGASPCDNPVTGGYRGVENRTYRAEIHQSGTPYGIPPTATSSHANATTIGNDPNGTSERIITVDATTLDGNPWRPGDCLEIYSQQSITNNTPGAAVRITAVTTGQPAGTATLNVVVIDGDLNVIASQTTPRVRRLASWKWSRDNGSVAFAVTEFSSDLPTRIRLQRIGRDAILAIRPTDWVEVHGDKPDLLGQPGTIAKVININDGTRYVDLGTDVSSHKDDGHVKCRRWDNPDGPMPIRIGITEELEDGVQIKFTGTTFRSSDHWTLAARTADPLIPEGPPQPPQGIQHHYARLAVVHWHEPEGAPEIHDCRRIFRPLSELDSCCITVGDGKRQIGDYDDIQKAIDALPPQGGCVLVLPGKYEVEEPIRITRDHVHLEGCNRLSAIVCNGAPALVVANASRTKTSNLVLASRQSDLGAVYARGAYQLTINDCHITNRVTREDLEDETPALLITDGEQISHDIQITASTLSGLVGASIRSHGTHIEDTQCPVGGIWLRNGTRNATINHNRIGGNSGHHPGWGILLGGAIEEDPEEPLAWRPGRNAAWYGTMFAAFLDGSDQPIQDIHIEANTIQGMDESGIGWRVFGASRNLSIIDNHITYCARSPTDPVGNAVLIGPTDNVVASGNTITGNGLNRHTFGLIALGVRNLDMHDNQIRDNGIEAEYTAPRPAFGNKEFADKQPGMVMTYDDNARYHAGSAYHETPTEGEAETGNSTDAEAAEADREAAAGGGGTNAEAAEADREAVAEGGRDPEFSERRTMVQPAEEPREEPEGTSKFPELRFQAAAVLAAFGGAGLPAMQVHDNLFACPRGPALLAMGAGSNSIHDNELLAEGDWVMGGFLRGRAANLVAYTTPYFDLQGRLRFDGNRVFWNSRGPPDDDYGPYEEHKEKFPNPDQALTLIAHVEGDASFEANHVRMETQGWPQLESSVIVRARSVRATGSRFEEQRNPMPPTGPAGTREISALQVIYAPVDDAGDGTQDAYVLKSPSNNGKVIEPGDILLAAMPTQVAGTVITASNSLVGQGSSVFATILHVDADENNAYGPGDFAYISNDDKLTPTTGDGQFTIRLTQATASGSMYPAGTHVEKADHDLLNYGGVVKTGMGAGPNNPPQLSHTNTDGEGPFTSGEDALHIVPRSLGDNEPLPPGSIRIHGGAGPYGSQTLAGDADTEAPQGSAGAGDAEDGDGLERTGSPPVQYSYIGRAPGGMSMAATNQADHCIKVEGGSTMNVHNQEKRCAQSEVSNQHVEEDG